MRTTKIDNFRVSKKHPSARAHRLLALRDSLGCASNEQKSMENRRVCIERTKVNGQVAE
uniref:Uncharacterized protein n=1 Tax=Setaria italica TaxID=4555 RepID=K4A477_SETIT